MSKFNKDTECVQGAYNPDNAEPRVIPIYQSTTYKYDCADSLGKLFDLAEDGHMYSRISNPTVAYLEEKIAMLEGGVGSMFTSSGQSAIFMAVFNITGCGQNIISLSSIYGGTVNLFAVTMKKMGIEVRFVTQDMSDAEIEALIDENTRLIYGETLANPALKVLDIERFANLAHKHNMPLFVDNTFATPIVCRPFEFGADVVVHSSSKYMDGHAQVISGAIVDSGNFDWNNGRYPELSTPDESYHGVIYTEKFGNRAFIEKARCQLMRDLGATPSPISAFLVNTSMESMHLRVRKHCENALTIAKYLENNDKISWVNYPLLESSPDYALAKKYLSGGASGVISFGVKGGKEAAMKFMDSLKLAKIVVHVADARTSVIHPASTTHRQLTDEQLVAGGITPDLIRFSVGIEDVNDIIADIEQALEVSVCR